MAQGSPVDFDLDTDNTITNNIGADESGTVRFPASLDGTNSGLTSNSVPITYAVSPDGLTLTGSAAGTSVFVITLDPGAGTYSLDMNGVVDSVTQVDFNDGGYNFVGGNNPWAEFIPIGETVGARSITTVRICCSHLRSAARSAAPSIAQQIRAVSAAAGVLEIGLAAMPTPPRHSA